MPVDLLVLGAALLTGLLGSVHCAAMCGGIATGFGMAAGAARPALPMAIRLNVARVAGYAAAGAIAGALGGGIVQLFDLEPLRIALRVLVGLVLVLAALRMLDRGGRLAFLQRPGRVLWRGLAPLQWRLLPASTPMRQWILGMLWGWLPCGLSTTLLFAAWLEASALHGALLMTAFGLGTLPAMLPLTYSGARAARWLARPVPRRFAATLLLGAGLLTLAAPWMSQVPAVHAVLDALGCRSLA